MDPFKEYPSSWAPGAELTCLGVRCSINSNVLVDAIGDSLFGEFLGCCLDETCSTMEEFLGHNGVCVCVKQHPSEDFWSWWIRFPFSEIASDNNN